MIFFFRIRLSKNNSESRRFFSKISLLPGYYLIRNLLTPNIFKIQQQKKAVEKFSKSDNILS